MLFMLLVIPTNHAEASEKKYLVLIQNDDSKWIAYENLTEVTGTGSVMLKAKQFSDIMDFTYTENTKKNQFSIKRSKGRYNTYTTNSTKYTYTNNKKTNNKKANYKAYKSKSDKSNLCIAESVNTLCKYKIFTGNKIKEYQELGYDGVLCYSIKGEIDKVPNILYVRYADGSGLKKRLSSDVSFASLTSDSYVNITLLDSDIDGMSVGCEVSKEEVITCSLGEFSNGTAPLYIQVKSEGAAVIHVFLEDNSEHLFIIVTVTSPPDSNENGSQSEPFYIKDKIFGITGTLTYSKDGELYNYTFNGKIVNITSEKIEVGDTSLIFYSEEGFTVSSNRINVHDLDPGMSMPVSFDILAFYEIDNASIMNSQTYKRLDPGDLGPAG